MTVFFTTFFVLTILGLVDTGYLVYKHGKKKPMVCPLEHDCSKVTESKWSTVLGVRNELLGFLFYVSLFFGMLVGSVVPALHPLLLLFFFISTSIGALYSLFLVIIQFAVIKDYCFYCMISASLTLLLFLNSLVLLAK